MLSTTEPCLFSGCGFFLRNGYACPPFLDTDSDSGYGYVYWRKEFDRAILDYDGTRLLELSILACIRLSLWNENCGIYVQHEPGTPSLG